jgi:hypothetical protein
MVTLDTVPTGIATTEPPHAIASSSEVEKPSEMLLSAKTSAVA